jgi:hypothetical protein
MTPATDVWTLAANWSNVSDERVEICDLFDGSTGTNFTQKEFAWGNTTYTWSVNVTDGETWINETYTYTTVSDASGADARYDMNNDGTVDVFDALLTWNKKAGDASYNNLYDVVATHGLIDVFDALNVWSHKSPT